MLPSTSNNSCAKAEPGLHQAVALEAAPRRVVHAVGKLTESVVRLLLPMTTLLQRGGVRQYVIVLEADGRLELIERHLAPGVSLSVMDESAGFMRRRKEWVAAYRDVQSGGAIDVLHLHGAAPLSLVAAMGGIDMPQHLLYSPLGFWDSHQSRWRVRASDLLTFPIRRLHAGRVLVDGAVSGRKRPRPQRDPVARIHPPLAPAFLTARKALDPAALVVASAGGKWRQASTSLAQLGVLAEHGASDACVFQWSGECDAFSTRILQAAGIRIYRDEDAMARAKRLSRAWAFVSAGPDHGFPWHIAEAMACGVPVVALDTPLNRRLVLGGLTGFLCRSAEEMLAPVLALIKHADLRRSLGNAGRQRVLEEFGQDAFVRRVLHLYGMAEVGPLDEALEVPRLRRVG